MGKIKIYKIISIFTMWVIGMIIGYPHVCALSPNLLIDKDVVSLPCKMLRVFKDAQRTETMLCISIQDPSTSNTYIFSPGKIVIARQDGSEWYMSCQQWDIVWMMRYCRTLYPVLDAQIAELVLSRVREESAEGQFWRQLCTKSRPHYWVWFYGDLAQREDLFAKNAELQKKLMEQVIEKNKDLFLAPFFFMIKYDPSQKISFSLHLQKDPLAGKLMGIEVHVQSESLLYTSQGQEQLIEDLIHYAYEIMHEMDKEKIKLSTGRTKDVFSLQGCLEKRESMQKNKQSFFSLQTIIPPAQYVQRGKIPHPDVTSVPPLHASKTITAFWEMLLASPQYPQSREAMDHPKESGMLKAFRKYMAEEQNREALLPPDVDMRKKYEEPFSKAV